MSDDDRRNVLKRAFERLQTDLQYQAPELHGNVIMQCYQDVAGELVRLVQERESLAARVLELQGELGELYMAADRRREGFTFSQRERGRRAALQAAATYDAEMEKRDARGEPRLDWWGYIVNAALAAACEEPTT